MGTPCANHLSSDHGDLMVSKDLVEAGRIRLAVNRANALRDYAVVLSSVESGHTRGKVVITVDV